MDSILELLYDVRDISWHYRSIVGALLSLILSLLVFSQLVGENDPAFAYSVPVPEQSRPGWKGEELESPNIKVSGVNAIQCYDPATGWRLGQVNPASRDGIDRAVAEAEAAQAEWANTTWSQRRTVLKTMLRFILDHQETIARVCCRDSGKPMLDANLGEIMVTAEKLKWVIAHGEQCLRPERRPTSFLMMYKHNEVRWEPLGVVAACVSWNYPFHNFIGPIISALFTGNAIVLKPSERTAWSSKYFLRIVTGALQACGHDPRLVQSLLIWPQNAPHLTSHRSISHITFIGSRPVAHHVLTSASRALTPVCVELGGKDPSIILPCVSDLSKVVEILLRGTFQSAGQNCIGIERIIAHESIYTRLVSLLEPRVRALRLGSSLDDDGDVDVGAMITGDQFDQLEALISEAVAQGARLVVGGKRFDHPQHPSGHYFTPTLLVDVEPSMRIAQEELFAPVCVVMRTGSVASAIQMANSTSYALGASVFGSNKADVEAVVGGVRAGMVSVNDFAVYYAVQLPFGGAGGSGYGRFAGEEGLRSLCNVKSVCSDRFGGVSTSLPKPYRYPVDEIKAWDVAVGIVRLGYGLGLMERVKGLWGIVRSAL